MMVLWGSLAGLLMYLELVYHFVGFGWEEFRPAYPAALIFAWTGVETLLIGALRGRIKRVCFVLAVCFPVVWTGAQIVYLRIFRQPLLWEAVVRGGGDALANYWREALAGILGALPFLILLVLPAVLLGLILKRRGWSPPDLSPGQMIKTAAAATACMAAGAMVMEVGKSADAEYYEDYHEFYDPLTVARTMGVLSMLQRDTVQEAAELMETVVGVEMAWNGSEGAVGSGAGTPGYHLAGGFSGPMVQVADRFQEDMAGRSTGQAGENTGQAGEDTGQIPGESPGQAGNVTQPSHPQAFSLDYVQLHDLAENDHQTWLADYMEGQVPVNSNEYTGKFQGYNLIFLTAEGFSTYAIDPELTPTLYRLSHSGFVFENYYVPLWQTSTSDGEYINCTGLIPDGQYSMRKSADNNMAYTLPRFFAEEGVSSFAYHNNSLTYYDRYLTHPNLGYDFKACRLGELSEEEWGDKIFPMEHPNAWPASDLEMMQGTMSEYLNLERFHVYYMTVSGHMNYDFSGNAMSGKNREAVAELPLSENARAYLACNIELDKALEYMLEQLKEAGQLERTVICLSADHYPYGMTEKQYEELAGKSLKEGLDQYRSSLILWNAGMEEEPVHITKACGSMDILPTLLNLFGFSYDSRMYAGRDIFSDREGMVIFNDRSFVTDALVYRKGKDPIWLQDEFGSWIVPQEGREDYLAERKKEVKDRYQFSAYILQENYYEDVFQAVQPMGEPGKS